MSQVLTANDIREVKVNSSWTNFLPAILVIVGGFIMMYARHQVGDRFITDGALMMLALACYILAALFQLTNLYAPSEMSRKIGLWMATLGVFFNLSSWLVRWVAAYDHEVAKLVASGNPITPWFFRYIPFANLYDLSVAFAFGAGIATLLIAHRKDFQILAAFSLPLAALILVLARFIGGEFIDLPPVLDSYWRPIHVGVASLSYGVTLVCFAIAVIYLLKDKVKVESMAIWASIFAFAVIATISKFSVFTEGVYRSGLFFPNTPKPVNAMFRLELPYVGMSLVIAGILLLVSIIAFLIYIYGNESIVNQKKLESGEIENKSSIRDWFSKNQGNAVIAGIAMITSALFGFGVVRRNKTEVKSGEIEESEEVIYEHYEWAKGLGHLTLKLAFLLQIIAVVFWVSALKSPIDVQAKLTEQLNQNPSQYVIVGKELAAKQQLSAQQIAQIPTAQFEQAGRQFLQDNGSKMYLSFGTNPVEFSGLLTAIAGIFFVILFSIRTEFLREKLPSLVKLDSLMYKTASLAFAGLAMLLITGAIWANESWGRPWGFDSKETGALIAWLTYAAFLHTRISRGWSGRSSAYFAIIGFFLVIFTYLGVSYLLPGLHSYA